ncbi:MAG: hypothetical protein ACREPE_15465 [Lysobacter sp.]
MSRKRARRLIALAVLLILLTSSLFWVSRPSRVATLLLDSVGASLGLEISASGAAEYRLRGTPMLLLRGVVAREPGAATPLLRADRIYLSLPWSTLRARGDDLTVQRIELDRPRLDLPALQRWLAKRPPSEKRFPTLTEGLRITDGSIANGDDSNGSWHIVGIHAVIPSLYPDRPMQARVRGRYLAPPLAIAVDLVVALSRPEALIQAKTTGIATNGRIAIESGDWRIPGTVALSGPLRVGDDDLRVTPARLGVAAAYASAETRVPFALGLHGPLRFDEATWTLAPAGVAVRRRDARADDPVPTLDARGALAFGHRMTLQLNGVIAHWPEAWPALPPPIGQSRSPLPFALSYDGNTDFTDSTALQLRRDATRFAGRFGLQDVLAWSRTVATDSPLPPITGTLTTPQLIISGAELEGVEIEFEDDETAASLP